MLRLLLGNAVRRASYGRRDRVVQRLRDVVAHGVDEQQLAARNRHRRRPAAGDVHHPVLQAVDHGGRHRSTVIDLFAKVGELAPGSYGLLYLHDDEDPGHELDFRIVRLVRGAVTEHVDRLLSPVIPTLEDEYPL